MVRSALAGDADRMNLIGKLSMSQAWHTAMLGRVKKFPRLPEMLGQDKRKKRQTSREMKAQFEALAATGKVQSVPVRS